MTKPSMAEQLKRNLNRRNLSMKSITAMVLFGIIILVFVFFGYGVRFTGGSMGAAAQVNSSYISLAEVNQETERLERMYSGMFGGQFGQAQRQFLAQQAVDSLIQAELISQYAEKSGIYSTDHEVKEVIVRELPYFQENGQFKFERYRSILEANQMSPGEFEKRIRKDRKNQRVRHLFEISSSPILVEADFLKELDGTQVEFRFVKFDREAIIEGLPIPAAEIAERLKDEGFKKRVEEDYKVNGAKFQEEEQVRAQHILVKFESGDKASEDQALKKIKEIQEKAAKEDFGKLAAQYSEDEGSKKKRGDLGFFGRGRMVPEFEKVAFEQAPGKISEPVKSMFGYHLIKVVEKKPARLPPLEEVQNTIARRLMAAERFETQMKKVEELVHKKDRAELDRQLTAMNLKWQEPGPVSLGADQVPALGSAKASQALFGLSAADPLSPLIQDGNLRFVLELKGRQAKKTESSPEIAALEKERAYDRFGQWVESLRRHASIHYNLDGERDSLFMMQ